MKSEPKPKKQRFMRPVLEADDLKRIDAILKKFPEMNPTSIVRRAIRELAEREKVA